jgi:hypothetical protein
MLKRGDDWKTLPLAVFTDADVHRVGLRELLGDLLHSVRPRGGEHQRLARRGAQLQDLLNLRLESHIQHPVCLAVGEQVDIESKTQKLSFTFQIQALQPGTFNTGLSSTVILKHNNEAWGPGAVNTGIKLSIKLTFRSAGSRLGNQALSTRVSTCITVGHNCSRKQKLSLESSVMTF